jgi:hypothetical protein
MAGDRKVDRGTDEKCEMRYITRWYIEEDANAESLSAADMALWMEFN